MLLSILLLVLLYTVALQISIGVPGWEITFFFPAAKYCALTIEKLSAAKTQNVWKPQNITLNSACLE